MGLGLIQVIQDRFVQTSVAYSGRLGSGTLPAATGATGGLEKMKEEQKRSSVHVAAECRGIYRASLQSELMKEVCPVGVCAEEAPRGRVLEEDGGTL